MKVGIREAQNCEAVGAEAEAEVGVRTSHLGVCKRGARSRIGAGTKATLIDLDQF
jgi:hypothetical protein